MPVRIRLSRSGKKNAPSFRIVAAPGRSSLKGKALEILGFFNPSRRPPAFSVKKERVEFWLRRGAKMSPSVEKILKGKGGGKSL